MSLSILGFKEPYEQECCGSGSTGSGAMITEVHRYSVAVAIGAFII